MEDTKKGSLEIKMITIKGTVSDIGNIGSLDNGCGMKLESDGKKIAIVGLTVADCKLLGAYFGKELEIKIGIFE